MILLKKKALTSVGVVAIATWTAFNLNIMRTSGASIEITWANVEALASEGEGGGTFPACQKNKGYYEKAYIPFCVNGKCQKNTWENKGQLDVNYCNQ
jgi:hypothetical protein